MPYLLSVDALLAILAANPSDPVVRWKETVADGEVFLSAVTIGEVEAAVQALPPSESDKRRRYEQRLDGIIPVAFQGRILPVDVQIARTWGRIRQQALAHGWPLEAEAAIEIATAVVFNFEYVTRREDFHSNLGLRVVDPW